MENKDKQHTSCPHDPTTLSGCPIGMYHCPVCGAMVVAGMDHPNDDEVREQGLCPYQDKIVQEANKPPQEE